MEHLYFKCDWTVRSLRTVSKAPGETMRTISEIASTYNCKLFMLPDWYLRSDGCYIIPFIWRAPSEEILKRCLEDLKDYIQFTNFQLSNEKDASTGDPYTFVVSVGMMEFIIRLEDMAARNATILQNT